VLLTLLDEADRSNFEIEVALPERSLLKAEIVKRGIKVIEVPHIADRSFSLNGVLALRRVIKASSPDIVHTHASLSGRVAARLTGKCKIIHTRHSVFPARGCKLLNSLINNIFSDAIIAVSPAAKDNLLAEGASERKIHVIYNGTKPVTECAPEERLRLRGKYNVPPDAFVVAQAARLTEVKGQEYVLDAAKLCENVLFLLAGDGDLKERLAKRINDENITNVRLLGFISEIAEIFNICDVQISASHGTEATSMALLNGMNLGKPAIATDYGGNPYVIRDGVNGLLIPCKSAEAIRGAVLRLKNDAALYDSLSEGARKEYAARFTAAEMARLTGELYNAMSEGMVR
jgi:glycosyltransferase involved in cell wall biosynthesis